MASFASNNSNNERVLFGRGGLFIALFCGIAATALLGLGVFKYEAGNCFSSLPNKTFAVEMASYYREGSVYIVAEGKISGGATDLTRRCAIIKQGGDKEVVDFPGGFVGPGKYLLVIEKHATATRDEHAGEVKAVKKTWQTYTFVPVP
ncbi:MAG: hypothetical protein HYS15_02570 [Candidatus Spechtbacteria bacterium]|nr:hypothetical protein [Candidatus Spechtbacteria bacterium]